MENDKQGDAGEEDVDIGEDTPPNEFPPVKIEKDPVDANSGSSSSCSSSSSGDGSSSSGGIMLHLFGLKYIKIVCFSKV